MPSTYYIPDSSDGLEDEFSWLQTAASTFDEKPSSTFVACAPSPASNTSSSSPSSAFFPDTLFNPDTDDSSSESDFNPGSESVDFGHTISCQHHVSSPPIGQSNHPLSSRSCRIRDRFNDGRIMPKTSPSLGLVIPQPRNECPRSSHPRNTQTAPDSASFSAVKSNPWECPHCPWIQRNKRTPDLKRHIRTHTRLLHPAQWVCCGILADDTQSSALSAEPSPYISMPGVGGCGRTFSRRDALKRHLNNNNNSCAGRLAASHIKHV
jgi:hypothetical protein